MRRRILAVLLCALPVAALAATDLVTAIQAAQQKDPAYQAMLAGSGVTAAKQAQARAMWLPMVALQAGAGYADTYSETRGAEFSAPALGSMSSARFTTDIGQATDTRWGVQLRQPLYSAERSASARQLEAQSALAGEQRRQGEQSLRLRVAESYFAVLAAEDSVHSLDAMKRAARESLDIAQEMFRLGKTPATDMHEAQAVYDAVEAQHIAAQSQLELVRAAFTDLTGLSASGLQRPRPDARLDGLVRGELAAQIDVGAAHHPLVKMSEHGQAIAQSEVDKLKAFDALSLDLVARYEDARTEGSNRFGDATYTQRGAWVGVQLTLPLFTGGMRDARRDEAAQLAEQARWQAQMTRVQVGQQVRSAWLGVSSGLAQVRSLEQGVRSARLKLDATRTGRELGARTMADELNAQQALFVVEANLLRTRYQVLMAALSLAAAAGELDDTRLAQVNALLLAD